MQPRFVASVTPLPTTVSPFTRYQHAVAQWLAEHRVSVGNNAKWEVTLNTPFECGVGNKTGVLFVHGLGDSPYFFSDVGERLCQHGFWVRTVLLPGHGSKPGDMLNASYSAWQDTAEYHIDAFSQQVNRLFLGGFSTGTHIAVVAASERPAISGLLLFSPAFEPNFGVTWLAPYMTSVYRWPNLEPEDNPTRYNSVAMQGFAAYQHSVDAVSQTLAAKPLSQPVFMVIPEGDSVVDVREVGRLYQRRFKHPDNALLWLGNGAQAPAGAKVLSMTIPAQRISAASHMSVLFSPGNPLYGIDGTLRICDNGQSDEKTARCEAGETVWYGPWGYTEENKVYARLTYNPYFDIMVREAVAFLNKQAASN
ncbi:alpha/beta hydrolase [Alteromonas gilva]|uniref:Alpha/beta fold hydrolase n=1 Tax=Alteromonas gilva TaxID=2987522 RepID=A0ABT5L5B9_9ALTE|nr:alpha/beta fold hydrolase [Alteromonas gilva]MDC8831561.1 alpha/beta fold hydrolase [Alteromonas gilva]